MASGLSPAGPRFLSAAGAGASATAGAGALLARSPPSCCRLYVALLVVRVRVWVLALALLLLLLLVVHNLLRLLAVKAARAAQRVVILYRWLACTYSADCITQQHQSRILLVHVRMRGRV